MSVNKVILVGNVGRDPEIRALESGRKLARFSLATNERFKDKQGQSQTLTEWHRVIAWGKQADIIEQYVKSGTLLYLEGRLRTRSYDKDGVTHYSTEIQCDTFNFLGGKSNQTQEQKMAEQPPQQPISEITEPSTPEPDDLPF